MTGRATTQAISATELTEGDSDAVRIRHQLDAWANASNRTPRLVATPVEDVGAESSGEVPLPATKRSRAAPASGRTKAAKATKTKAARTAKAKMTEAETTGAETAEVDGEPEASNAPLEPPTVFAAPTVPEAVPATPERARTSRAFALVAALALATVAAYFSVAGMAEIFPGAPVAVMVLAATMEAGKLVIAGWLAAHWRRTNWKMRFVMVALVAGLALINAAGVFGKLVEAHVSVAATSRSGVTERIEALDARVTAQTAAVADLDSRIAQIDRAVDEFDKAWPGDAGHQHRDATAPDAGRVGYAAAGGNRNAGRICRRQRAALAGERSRIEASAGPIQYLAMMVGAAPEVAVRWLILLMVLCCDPAAIALTVAAAGSRAAIRGKSRTRASGLTMRCQLTTRSNVGQASISNDSPIADIRRISISHELGCERRSTAQRTLGRGLQCRSDRKSAGPQPQRGERQAEAHGPQAKSQATNGQPQDRGSADAKAGAGGSLRPAGGSGGVEAQGV